MEEENENPPPISLYNRDEITEKNENIIIEEKMKKVNIEPINYKKNHYKIPVLQPYVVTLAGSGIAGHKDGIPETAQLHNPWGVEINSRGDILFCDNANGSIRKIDAITGYVSTLPGIFSTPIGIAIDADDNVYVSDFSHTIKKITTAGAISVLAGKHNFSGIIDGIGTGLFTHPWGLCTDLTKENIYVADFNNHAIRKVNIKNRMVTTLIGTATYLNPCGVCVDYDGSILVADKGNNAIKRIDVNQQTVITVSGSTLGSNDGPATTAKWNGPTGIAVDDNGVIYVADQYNRLIRKIEDGVVTTIAGEPEKPGRKYKHIDGPLETAKFCGPASIVIDHEGNLIIADLTGHRIRKIVLYKTDPNAIDIWLSPDVYGPKWGDCTVEISSKIYYVNSQILSVRCPNLFALKQ